MLTFKSISPYDQSLLAEYTIDSDQIIEQKISKASQAFKVWRKETFLHRGAILIKVAEKLRFHKGELAKLMALEMGKVLEEGRSEIEKCATTCEFYALNGEKFLVDEKLTSSAKNSFAAFEPLGVILAIMPWNFPFWQVFRFVAPTLMAGNTALLKHAQNVTGCAIKIEEIIKEAGAIEGVFQTLILPSDQLEKVISNDIIQGISLTGSEMAGSSVASLGGKYIRRTVLELGGSDPLIVLADADLNKAADIAIKSRMQNAGQSCIAAKRFIVLKSVLDEFVHLLTQKIALIKQGNPLEESFTMGPMAREDLATGLLKQLNESKEAGAELIIGGNCDKANFQPALLINVPKNSPAFNEETFGPLAAVVSVKTDEDAINLANSSRYGLGASIWTKDLEKGEKLAREIESGSVFINAWVKSEPNLPFGGIKKSGYGRELSHFGMKAFVNIKTIYVGE